MVILHKDKRSDNHEEIKGFLTKRWGQYHIASELDESIVYSVIEESIEPCMENAKSAKIDEI